MRGACHAKVIPFRADLSKEVSISAAGLETFRRARTFLTTLREDLFKASQSRSSQIIELTRDQIRLILHCFKGTVAEPRPARVDLRGVRSLFWIKLAFNSVHWN